MRFRLQHNGQATHSIFFGLEVGPWLARLLLLCSGALVPLIFSPFDFWLLALVLPIIFWQLTYVPSARQAGWHGWWFGLGFFGAGVSWVYFSMRAVHTPMPMSLLLSVLFCLCLAFLFALQAWLGAYSRRLAPYLSLPLLWVLFELVRSTLLTGLPWLIWGTASTDTWFSGWLTVGGVFSVSLIWLFCAALAWQWLQQLRHIRFIIGSLSLLIASAAGGLGLQQIQWTQPVNTTELRVSVIQGNVAQDQKWDPEALRQDFVHYQQLSQQHAQATLIVWPETAIAAFAEQLQPELGDFTKQLNAQGLLAGMPVWGEHGQYYNAVQGFGLVSGEYRKQHLVPFGEYLPFASVLQGLTEFFALPMSGFSAGPRYQPPLRIEQDGHIWQLGALICYEVAFPWLVRRQARQAEVLIVVSNDAWFGRSWAPAQHLQISRGRAIENQRAMVRATQNGISALIAPNGDLLAQSEQFVTTTLSGSVVARQGYTPYQRWGEWPLMLVMVGLLLLMLARARQSKFYSR